MSLTSPTAVPPDDINTIITCVCTPVRKRGTLTEQKQQLIAVMTFLTLEEKRGHMLLCSNGYIRAFQSPHGMKLVD